VPFLLLSSAFVLLLAYVRVCAIVAAIECVEEAGLIKLHCTFSGV
jgi:hypothetical protein